MKMDMNPDNMKVDNREKERDRRGRGARGSRFSDADMGGVGGAGNGGGGGIGGLGIGRERSRERRNCRVYISNIPYDYRWQDLKDLFRRDVGSVEYVELFHDETGKARGCGIVEFKDPDNVEMALEKMNRYEINGRELVVKEDHGEQRDQFGRIMRDGIAGGGGGGAGGVGGGVSGIGPGLGGVIGGGRGGMGIGGGGGGESLDRDRGFARRDDDRSGRNNFNMMSNDFNSSSNYNLYGLSASFLESLGISGPLHNKVFVANLDYKVDSKKLKQVFKLAGKVQSVDLSVDKEGNSRGFAVVEFDHPVEAVQAISMLDRQMLYERRMTVRLDRIPDKGESLKLPEGLGGIGIGLGPNGEPLRDVARNLPNIIGQQQQQQQVQQQQQQAPSQQQQQLPQQQNASSMLSNIVATMGGSGGVGGGGGGGVGAGGSGGMYGNAAVQPSPVAPVVQATKAQAAAVNLLGNAGGGLNLSNLSSSNLAALSNVVGGLGAALSNPLLTNQLTNLGLNLGQNTAVGSNDDSIASGNAAHSNNYSTGGNNYSSGYGGSSAFNSNVGGGGGNSGGGGGGGGGGYNSYNSSGGGGGGNSGGGMDGNDYNSGNMSDMYGGGGGGGSGGNLNNARKSDTIIIKNIPLSCTWQTLRDKFRDVGEVKFAEIRGNDVGVVRFFKERDAELAIALMDGSRMDGRTIKVTYF